MSIECCGVNSWKVVAWMTKTDSARARVLKELCIVCIKVALDF
jgi:hypothetical protein